MAPVAPVVVHQRTDFAASMTDGRTRDEVNQESRSAHEIEQLWAYISDRLRKFPAHCSQCRGKPCGHGCCRRNKRPVAGFRPPHGEPIRSVAMIEPAACLAYLRPARPQAELRLAMRRPYIVGSHAHPNLPLSGTGRSGLERHGP